MTFDEAKLIQHKIVPLKRKKRNSQHALWVGTTTMRLDRENTVRIDVTTNKLGTILSSRDYPYDRLPKEQANPLYAALTLFCQENELETLLRDPDKAQIKTRINVDKNETTFEVSVQWLLAMLGYQTIWLHRYQTLWSNQVDVGSVDCLAYSASDDILLLVNCSLLAPHSKELIRYAEVRERVAQKIFIGTTTTTHAVVFTGSHTTVGQEEPSANGVRIVHRDEIGKLLNYARSGKAFNYAEFAHPFLGRRFRD